MCLAIHLDCLLEGALAGIDCDLVSTYEEQQMWWWIGQICHERVDTHLRGVWQMVWAEMWLHISQAMFSVSTTSMSFRVLAIGNDVDVCSY